MPDITKCTNNECILSYSCLRFTSKASEFNQSYDRFIPQEDDVLEEYECKMYLVNK